MRLASSDTNLGVFYPGNMKRIILVAFLTVSLYACKSSINSSELYGKWKYIHVEKPNANPPDSVSTLELNAEQPFIEFSPNNTLQIIWDGKVLSHGKFTIDGQDIRYTEKLPGGATRQFPFWVSKLTDKQIIFETSGEEGSRVTAEKE